MGSPSPIAVRGTVATVVAQPQQPNSQPAASRENIHQTVGVAQPQQLHARNRV